MGLVWVLLAVVLGLVVGWLLRSVVAKRQVARARSHNVETTELERLRTRVEQLEHAATERDQLVVELTHTTEALEAARRTLDDRSDRATRPAPIDSPDQNDLDLAAAALGASIERDDLKVIDGIGPNVEDLCHGIGIRTWSDLSNTEVSLLRTMLADAGPRFQTHDPETWPRQAALLAEGRWSEFAALTHADHGR
jgi:predicted flap endonuclease-1-like 5' DNA nuclease